MSKIRTFFKRSSKENPKTPPTNNEFREPRTPSLQKGNWISKFFSKKKPTKVQITGNRNPPSSSTNLAREQIEGNRRRHPPLGLGIFKTPSPIDDDDDVEEPSRPIEIHKSDRHQHYNPKTQNSSLIPYPPSPSSAYSRHATGSPYTPPMNANLDPYIFSGRVDTSRTSIDYFSGQPARMQESNEGILDPEDEEIEEAELRRRGSPLGKGKIGKDVRGRSDEERLRSGEASSGPAGASNTTAKRNSALGDLNSAE